MTKFIKIFICLIAISCSQKSISTKETTISENQFYNFSLNKPDGTPIKMDTYQGKVVLIVNTATKCGLTPQFEGLQLLHTNYEDKGLAVLGVPCNQFLNQEPNSNEEMEFVCRKNHGVTFQLFEKNKVNGKDAAGLYKFLRKFNSEAHGSKIRWNFEKFLINKKGQLVKRFNPRTKPKDIEKYIIELLQ